jgi:hypothetical protein
MLFEERLVFLLFELDLVSGLFSRYKEVVVVVSNGGFERLDGLGSESFLLLNVGGGGRFRGGTTRAVEDSVEILLADSDGF